MNFRVFHYALLFLTLMLYSSPSYAMGPRLLYVEPASSLSDVDGSLMGKYLYLGVIFADDNPAGFAGPSVKVGWGQTGKKLNISYMGGTRFMSLEAGVSYLKQDVDASSYINNEREGYAFETALRFNAVSIIGVFTKEKTSVEFGLGF